MKKSKNYITSQWAKKLVNLRRGGDIVSNLLVKIK